MNLESKGVRNEQAIQNPHLIFILLKVALFSNGFLVTPNLSIIITATVAIQPEDNRIWRLLKVFQNLVNLTKSKKNKAVQTKPHETF